MLPFFKFNLFKDSEPFQTMRRASFTVRASTSIIETALSNYTFGINCRKACKTEEKQTPE